MRHLILISFGFAFGVTLILSGATSWKVINDMFSFKSFQMYGVIATAILTVVLGLFILKRSRRKDIISMDLNLSEKPLEFSKNALGGLTFGIGWGITGACTAPLFLRIGSTPFIGLLMLSSAVIGAALYVLIFNRK